MGGTDQKVSALIAPATNAGQPNHAPSNVHASPSPGVSAENPPGNPNNPYGSIATRNVFGLNPPTLAVVDTRQGPATTENYAYLDHNDFGADGGVGQSIRGTPAGKAAQG